jgi:hypothetical protein
MKLLFDRIVVGNPDVLTNPAIRFVATKLKQASSLRFTTQTICSKNQYYMPIRALTVPMRAHRGNRASSMLYVI